MIIAFLDMLESALEFIIEQSRKARAALKTRRTNRQINQVTTAADALLAQLQRQASEHRMMKLRIHSDPGPKSFMAPGNQSRH